MDPTFPNGLKPASSFRGPVFISSKNRPTFRLVLAQPPSYNTRIQVSIVTQYAVEKKVSLGETRFDAGFLRLGAPTCAMARWLFFLRPRGKRVGGHGSSGHSLVRHSFAKLSVRGHIGISHLSVGHSRLRCFAFRSSGVQRFSAILRPHTEYEETARELDRRGR